MSKDDRLFVNRVVELELFNELLDSFNGDSTVDSPKIFEYVAMAGTGKTTLFSEFKKQSESRKLKTLDIDFSVKRQSVSDILFIIDTFLGWFNLNEKPEIKNLINQIQINITEESISMLTSGTSDSIKDALTSLIHFMSVEKTIFFIDSVENCSPSDFEWFAYSILRPLVSSGNVLVYLASRKEIDWGRLNYQIKRRYLRLYELLPLSLDATQLQIKNLGGDPSLAYEIHKLSGGNGTATVDIVKAIALLNVKVDSRNFGDFERRLVESLHRDFINRVVRIPDDLYRAFQILSVLRRYYNSLPTLLKEIINPLGKPGDLKIIMDRMNTEPDSQLVKNNLEGWFEIEPVIRKILALRLRFTEPALYKSLSESAYNYYDQRFTEERRPAYLREKLYHFIDIKRLEEPPKSDVEIVIDLRKEITKDLQTILWEFFINSPNNFGRIPKETRVSEIEALKESLAKDDEFRDKLGDHDDVGFLSEVIDSILDRLESLNRLSLSIQKIGDDPVKGSNYAVTIQIGDRPMLHGHNIDFSKQEKKTIMKRVNEISDVASLEKFGRALWSKTIPGSLQDTLSNNGSPLVISVNDNSLPWELMHDGDDFIMLKVPLGKLPIGKISPNFSASRNSSLRVLLIGVAETNIEGFKNLETVDQEINDLIELFENSDGIEFDRANDVIWKDSDSWVLQEKLGEKYNIIHYAGHTDFSDLKEGGALVLHNEKFYFNVLSSIKFDVAPFVFLNACKTVPLDVTHYDTSVGSAIKFLESGAIGCVSTIWDVDDRLGSQFNYEFYKLLLENIPVGEALRRIKKDYRQKYPNNISWASYSLFGYPDYKIFQVDH